MTMNDVVPVVLWSLPPRVSPHPIPEKPLSFLRLGAACSGRCLLVMSARNPQFQRSTTHDPADVLVAAPAVAVWVGLGSSQTRVSLRTLRGGRRNRPENTVYDGDGDRDG
jgi:hypothetical protein